MFEIEDFRKAAKHTADADAGLRIEFYEGFENDTKESEGWEEMTPAGQPIQHSGTGLPAYRPVDYIRIFIPGDLNTKIDRAMTWCGYKKNCGREGPIACDRHRFGHLHKQWKDGKEASPGMPLDQWAAVTRAHVENLKYHEVRTVEQLAAISDGNLERLGAGFLSLRQKARDYLAVKKDESSVFKMRAELESRDARVADLERILKEQGDKIQSLQSAQKSK